MTQPNDPADTGALLAAAARAVARGADLDAKLDALLAIALADGGASAALVASVGDDGLVHALRTAGPAAAPPDGPSRDVPAPDDAATADDPVATAIMERRVVDASAVAGIAPGWFAARHGLARVVAVPLVVAEAGIERAVGALALGWRAGETPHLGAEGVLEAIADLAAVALQGAAAAAGAAERGDWQERLAHLDPLTGLASRRTLDRVLELEIARAGRQRTEVSVAAFDVDGFRAANEAHGPAVGDAMLRAVAAVLAEQVRLVDTVARIGGDEFVIVAPGSGGVAVADRILHAIEGLGSVRDVPVTVSAGIARFPADGTSADELLDAALGALEAARTSGRGAIAEVRAR